MLNEYSELKLVNMSQGQQQANPKARDAKLFFESGRLETYKGIEMNFCVNVCDLAESGFVWTGYGDHVECVFCHGVIGEWEDGDIVSSEHSRLFPLCPYIRLQGGGKSITIKSLEQCFYYRDFDTECNCMSVKDLERMRLDLSDVSDDDSEMGVDTIY